MKPKRKNPAKELYKQLRALPLAQLWTREVPAFDRAPAGERIARVALVRAVGVVFSETGTAEEKEHAREWLRGLLHDPAEIIRRYAAAALPKLGAGERDEAALLALLRETNAGREKQHVAQALDKIGGAETLKTLRAAPGEIGPVTEQKVKAGLARRESPSVIHLEGTLADAAGLRIHLRGRRGLENLIRDEAAEWISRTGAKFRIVGTGSGLVVLQAEAGFSLDELYSLRCFGTVGFVLGNTSAADEEHTAEAIAAAIASDKSRFIMEAFTHGSLRYRLEFLGKGHLRALVRRVAALAYRKCPAILNDAQQAPWAVDVYSAQTGGSIELRPRLSPDPRFLYRRGAVPAASHPPLAACMAQLAGKQSGEMIWDPFCGSGLELAERGLLGNVSRIYGTDLSPAALEIARTNMAAAGLPDSRVVLLCCDFRKFMRAAGVKPGSLSLIITNPPMGKRVPIRDLDRLIRDLFIAAAEMLRPLGRLIFANPLRMEPPGALLKLESRQTIDFGGFDCWLERHVKQGAPQPGRR